MAVNGADLALDDYIKATKKKGTFTIRRGGAGGGRGRRAGGAGTGRYFQGSPASSGSPAATGGRGRRRGSSGGQQQQKASRLNQWKNNQGRGYGRARVNGTSPGFRNSGGGFGGGRRGFNSRRGSPRRRNNNNLQQLQPLMHVRVNTPRGSPQRRQGFRFRNNRNYRRGSSLMPLMATGGRGGRNAGFSPRRGGGSGSLRRVMNLARKKVQRARLQLNRRSVLVSPRRRGGGGGGGSPMRQLMMPMMPGVTSGLRRTRTGFVTVGNPVEKAMAQLIVKDKIEKARLNRLNRGGSMIRSNNNPPDRGYHHQQQQPRHRSSASAQTSYGGGRRHTAAAVNLIHHQIRSTPPPQQQQQQQSNLSPAGARGGGGGSGSLNAYSVARSIPAMGYSMYADREMMAHHHSMMQQQQHHQGGYHQHISWGEESRVVPIPAMPTASPRAFYDPRNPAIINANTPPPSDAHHQRGGGLNPDIQRKISFIQSHANRSSTSSSTPPGTAAAAGASSGIIQDFRAPIFSSSAMKLGDRFRMYMQ